MKLISVTTLAGHVYFVDRNGRLPQSLCGRGYDGSPLPAREDKVCGGCLTVAVSNDLTRVPVLTPGSTLDECFSRLYGPDPEPIPFDEIVDRCRKVPA